LEELLAQVHSLRCEVQDVLGQLFRESPQSGKSNAGQPQAHPLAGLEQHLTEGALLQGNADLLDLLDEAPDLARRSWRSSPTCRASLLALLHIQHTSAALTLLAEE